MFDFGGAAVLQVGGQVQRGRRAVAGVRGVRAAAAVHGHAQPAVDAPARVRDDDAHGVLRRAREVVLHQQM